MPFECPVCSSPLSHEHILSPAALAGESAAAEGTDEPYSPGDAARACGASCCCHRPPPYSSCDCCRLRRARLQQQT